MIGSWLKYLVHCKSEYGIHSPFVYEFMRKVLNDSGSNRDYDTIYRIARLRSKRKLSPTRWCRSAKYRR